jgi:nucleotide-binding universal stress UspA family protein
MFKTIIWATDGSEAADDALPFAKALADVDGAELIVLHANEVFVGRAAGYPVLADETELEEKIRQQVDELRAEGFEVTFKLLTGVYADPAHTIADAARELEADTLVVGTRGLSTIKGLLVGSVTHRLLHIAPCPVLAVPRVKTPALREHDAAATGATS